MYYFVDIAEVKPYKKFCTDILTELRNQLKVKHEINVEFYLVGSGANNFVTKNGNEPFDLDYNLRILKMPQKFWYDLKLLKDTVLSELNIVVGDTFFSNGREISYNFGVTFKKT